VCARIGGGGELIGLMAVKDVVHACVHAHTVVMLPRSVRWGVIGSGLAHQVPEQKVRELVSVWSTGPSLCVANAVMW